MMRSPKPFVPTESRATVTDAGRWLTIEVEPKRHWGALLFTIVWLCGWAAGELVAAGVLLVNGLARFGIEVPLGGPLEGIQVSTLDGGALTFVLLWFTLWTIGGFAAIRGVLWMVFGSEAIRVDADALTVRRKSIGRDDVRRFDADGIRHLRVAFKARMPTLGEQSGPFAFDYGAEAHRFGGDLSEAEARRLLPQILPKLPPEAAGRDSLGL